MDCHAELCDENAGDGGNCVCMRVNASLAVWHRCVWRYAPRASVQQNAAAYRQIGVAHAKLGVALQAFDGAIDWIRTVQRGIWFARIQIEFNQASRRRTVARKLIQRLSLIHI